MAQQTLLKAVSAATESTSLYIKGANSVTIQCTPNPTSGFSGMICVDGAFVPDPSTNIVFPIATFKIPAWFEVALLDFSAHAVTVAFTLSLSGVWTWLRARVVTANVGSISMHIAY